jgi:hypothetical protein
MKRKSSVPTRLLRTLKKSKSSPGKAEKPKPSVRKAADSKSREYPEANSSNQGRKAVVQHIPFRTFLEDEDVEGLLRGSFLNAAPGERDWDIKSLPGYPEYLKAFPPSEDFLTAADADPRSVLLTKRILLQIICFIEHQVCREESALNARAICDEIPLPWPLQHQVELPATRTILGLLDYLIGTLQNLPASVQRACAPDRDQWPCLVSMSDLRSNSPLRPRLKELKLGTNPGSGRPNPNELNRICRLMIETIQENKRAVEELRRAQEIERLDPLRFHACYQVIPFPQWAFKCAALKPLSIEGAWKEWFDVAWEAVLEATNGHPERDPRLRPLGKFRNNRRVVKDGNAKAGTREANIRDGIRSSLKRAFPAAALYPA